jgi:type VI secretion system protein ImpM
MPLAAEGGMRLGLYGKHPARGDFIESGIIPDLLHSLEQWLDAVLPAVKSNLGVDWERVWDQRTSQRPLVFFWLGEAIWGQVVAGVMAPSCDRVARRFPLLILAYGHSDTALPAPVIDPSQEWYAAMAAGLRRLLERTDFHSPADLLTDFPRPVTDATYVPAPTEFWAVRPGADVAALLEDIKQIDHRRALSGRSYWWSVGLDHEESNLACVSDRDRVALPGAGSEVERESVTRAIAAGSADLHTHRAFGFDATKTPRTLSQDSRFSDLPAWLDPDLPEDTIALDVQARQYVDHATPAPDLVVSKPSQVHAGPGLPQGAVLAWFLRGAP